MWASAPGVPFAELYRERIGTDPTPPLYHTLLALLRRMGDLPITSLRLETTALNIAFVCAASGTVLLHGRRIGLAALSRFCVAALLLSGPVLAFVPEARTYALAMAIVFVASWLAAACIVRPGRRESWWGFALTGLLSGVVHLFAAIACGGLGAGLVAVGLAWRRPRLLVDGFALGIGAGAATGALLLWTMGPADFVEASWNEFSLPAVRIAASEARQLIAGGPVAPAVLLAAMGCALAAAHTRALVAALGIAMGLLVAIPIALSLEVPIITGRYWAIGGPAVVVFTLFIAHQSFAEPRSLMRRSAGALAGLFIALSSVAAFPSAYNRTLGKPVWRGAALVRSLVAGCPAGSVHSLDTPEPYSQIVLNPPGLFVDASDPATPWLAAAQARCPVLGYAEHVLRGTGYVEQASEQELLGDLKITAAPGAVRIVRYPTGYVVLGASGVGE